MTQTFVLTSTSSCPVAAHGGGSPLLAKTMGVMANVLQRSADQQGGEFNSRPFFRICLGFISELAPSDPSDAIGFGMVAALATVFHALQVSQGV